MLLLLSLMSSILLVLLILLLLLLGDLVLRYFRQEDYWKWGHGSRSSLGMVPFFSFFFSLKLDVKNERWVKREEI